MTSAPFLGFCHLPVPSCPGVSPLLGGDQRQLTPMHHSQQQISFPPFPHSSFPYVNTPHVPAMTYLSPFSAALTYPPSPTPGIHAPHVQVGRLVLTIFSLGLKSFIYTSIKSVSLSKKFFKKLMFHGVGGKVLTVGGWNLPGTKVTEKTQHPQQMRVRTCLFIQYLNTVNHLQIVTPTRLWDSIPI